MSLTRWSVDEAHAHVCPEYTRDQIVELWGGRRSLTLAEILSLPIPLEDRSWFALQVCDGLWTMWVKADGPLKWETPDEREQAFLDFVLENYE